MNKLIIDRFEGNYAVCEWNDKSLVNVPKYKLPLNCKEGDILILDSQGMYQNDTETTLNSESRIKEKMNRLFE